MGSMGASPSTFRIANHTLVRSDDGPLEVEATLFPPAESGVATTSASEARARLAWSGLTPVLARQAFEALNQAMLASYASADCVRAVLPKLGPSEMFAGKTYLAGAEAYEGSWFDLRALVADLRMPSAGLVLQGLYLVSLLGELAPSTTITLENGGSGKAARIAFLKPNSVIGALGRLTPRSERHVRADDVTRADLGRLLRDEASVATIPARARFFAVEQALAEIDKPARGRLTELELWTIERQLVANDARGALERIQTYVKNHGNETPATRYLRAHLALVEGTEPARRIAEALLDEGRSGQPFYELDLLKARAWKAAGAWTYARHFARALVHDPNVSDEISLAAHDIVELANARGMGSGASAAATYGREPVTGPSSQEAPPTERVPQHGMPFSERRPESNSEPKPQSRPLSGYGSVQGTPIYVLTGGAPVVEPAPSSLDVLVEFEDPISRPNVSTALALVQPISEPAMSVHEAHLVPNSDPELPPVPPSSNPPPSTLEAQVVPEATTQIIIPHRMPPELRRTLDRGHETDRPPAAMTTLQPRVPRAQVAYPYIPEEVETLALPGGLSDEQLAEGVAARNGDEVRIVSTRFSRALAREYREKYKVRLRTDAQAIELMQRHLVSRWGTAGMNSPEATWDVRRHGALLSEILARTLDAEWVDVAPSEIGYWAMFVPPRTRTWPFGRVYRFLTLGHHEKDLVSYYLDLVARARDGA
jgi:hypothetical protein